MNASAVFHAGARRVVVGRRAANIAAVAATAALLLTGAAPAGAALCSAEDDTHVSGTAQCLLMRRYGAPAPRTLLVWLHGDVSAGGPANYHYPLAQQAAAEFAADAVLSVALVRPGYPDGSGEASTAALLEGGRSDHYTAANLGEVGAAIARLRERFRPQRVVVVGHSGGAATAAVLLGMKPGLIDAAVLVACPCDLVAWRAGRSAWRRSENPMRWVDRVDPAARVIALTGSADTNTAPALADAYVQALRGRAIDARFEPLPDATHNSALRSPRVLEAVATLLAPH